MSVVTNVILCLACGEGTRDDDANDALCPQVKRLNQWLAESGVRGGLVRIDQHFGGSKAAEVDVYAAAVNHLPIDEFIVQVWRQEYEDPDQVQLFVKEQEAERFREVPR